MNQYRDNMDIAMKYIYTGCRYIPAEAVCFTFCSYTMETARNCRAALAGVEMWLCVQQWTNVSVAVCATVD